MHARHTCRIAAFAFALLGAGSLGGCLERMVAEPRLSLHSVSLPGAPLRFAVEARRINTIGTVVVWSETRAEPLWAFRFRGSVHPEELKTLTYGVLPPVSDPVVQSVRQVFPLIGDPRPVPPGERFVVRVWCQYDWKLAPCRGHWDSRFRIEPDGSVTAMDPPDDIQEPGAVKQLTDALYGPDPI